MTAVGIFVGLLKLESIFSDLTGESSEIFCQESSVLLVNYLHFLAVRKDHSTYFFSLPLPSRILRPLNSLISVLAACIYLGISKIRFHLMKSRRYLKCRDFLFRKSCVASVPGFAREIHYCNRFHFQDYVWEFL
jgi:hypothetical protein